jgi:hypothetical protein
VGVKSGRRVGLTTLPPSMSRMSENVGASTSRDPKGLHGLYRDKFIFILQFPRIVCNSSGRMEVLNLRRHIRDIRVCYYPSIHIEGLRIPRRTSSNMAADF